MQRQGIYILHQKSLISALITAAKKLRHYVQTHTIILMTNYPIKFVLKKPQFNRSYDKWFISLSSFDIKYKPWTKVNSQALAKFVPDFSLNLAKKEDHKLLQMNVVNVNQWTIFYRRISKLPRSNAWNYANVATRRHDSIIHIL